LMEGLHQRAQQSGGLTLQEVQGALGGNGASPRKISAENSIQVGEVGGNEHHTVEVNLPHLHRKIKPQTDGQAAYIKAIRQHDLTFCRGPAGCGKTYLAVALAVEALKSRAIRKIVLVRPAVEAGESLGFLPGDLQAKLNPYLRPLLDALNEMLDYDQVKYLMEHDVIEVIPLAYMRGRTLNGAFIILDEAQNTTSAQMKMFLTRMGEDSKIVVSGDITQVDLPGGVTSGLRDAWHRLAGLRGVSFVTLGANDIVRHRLVQEIVGRYEARHAADTGLDQQQDSELGSQN
jgi:phosphate starvation-inducible PhoH-like protein